MSSRKTPFHSKQTQPLPRSAAKRLNDFRSLNNSFTLTNSSSLSVSSSITPLRDVSVEFDFAYNRYLLALGKQQILKEEIAKALIIYNDQLDIYRNKLLDASKSFHTQQINKEKEQILKQIYAKMEQLQSFLDDFDNIVDSNVNASVISLRNALKSESEKLYLKNVTVSKAENQHALLEENVADCISTLEKFISLNGNVEGINELFDVLRDIIKLFETVAENCKALETLKNDAFPGLLDNISNAFYPS